VPIQSQIQISGDTLLLAVIRLTLVADDGDEIADGVDVRCTNVADTLQSTLFVAATAFLFLVLLESSAVPELPLIVQFKLCACQPASEMIKLCPLSWMQLQLIVHPLTFCAFCMLVNSEPTVFVVLAAAWWTCHLMI